MTETKKTSSGKKGPCVKCGKTRFIADRDGRCSTCSRAAKTKIKGATTTPERGKSDAIETLPASPGDIQKGKTIVREMGERLRAGSFLDKSTPQPSKPAPDMTVAEVAALPISHIIDMIKAKRATHLAEAEKLGKAIVLLESL